jgi:hypothetical protein
MGEILGLGLSHYPYLRVLDDNMAAILRNTLKRPDVPEWWKDSSNWPGAMQAEWGDDEGRGAAPKHRAAFIEHLRVLRKALDDFNPDFILMWGDDQYENFREDIIPPFCIYAYDDLDIYPHRPRVDQRAMEVRTADVVPTQSAPAVSNVWREGGDTVFQVRGKREAAKFLTRGLLREKVDMAYSYQPLHYDGLSHAFLNGIMYLDYDRRGFEYALVPMQINCYGSRVLVNRGGQYPVGKISVPEVDLDPPAPSPERCMEVGAAVARVLQRSPWRVALVASSSWSHAFLTPKHYFIYPDMEADRQLYDRMVRGDYDYWRRKTEADVVDAGQQEVLNWWALMGAMEQLGRSGPAYHGYIESYVMNSNKAFAVWPSA